MAVFKQITSSNFVDWMTGMSAGLAFRNDGGAVNVIFGSSTGLVSDGDQYRNQNSTSIIGKAELGDAFGFSVSVGDFNGNGYADLAVGVPGEDLEPIDEAGSVNVIYGASTGLISTDNQLWNQDSADITGTAEDGDQFGYTVLAENVGNGSQADLIVGVPFEDNGGVTDNGGVNVIYGKKTGGLSATDEQYWNQNSTDIKDSAEDYDDFGFSLALGSRT